MTAVLLLPPGGGAAGRQGDLLPVQLVPRDRAGLGTRGPGAGRRAAPDECPRLSEVLVPGLRPPAALWEREWGCSTSATSATRGRAGRWTDPSTRRGPGCGSRRTVRCQDDRRLHQAALAYASDLTLLSAATVPHGVFIGLERAGGVPGPRDVVPPAVPGRRLAALRPGLALGLCGPGAGHRAPLPARHPGRRRRPRGSDPPVTRTQRRVARWEATPSWGETRVAVQAHRCSSIGTDTSFAKSDAGAEGAMGCEIATSKKADPDGGCPDRP